MEGGGKEVVNKNNVFGNTRYGLKGEKILFNIICCTSASRESKISLKTVIILINTVNGTIKLEKITWQLR